MVSPTLFVGMSIVPLLSFFFVQFFVQLFVGCRFCQYISS